MKTNEIKRCPFCGAGRDREDLTTRRVSGRTPGWERVMVRCTRCDATGPSVFMEEEDIRMAQKLAVLLWGIRR